MKLTLSQNLTSTVSAEFDPATHPNIKAFYKFKSLGGADISNVSNWTDQTGNFDMLQATDSEKPQYTASTGAVSFDGANESLQTASDISLDEQFTIAVRLNLETPFNNDVVLADNTTTGHFIRIKDADTITVRIAGSTAQDFDLNSGAIQDATNFNLIVSRNDDGLIKIFFNGTEQTDTNTRTGTFLIDAIGVRATDANDLEGSIFEVQIYDDISFSTAGFITKVNNRLASL
tara:strand:+ start:2711 stop:3406 length:696 start_codon:yes stop_codon:yes gene_type:complete